MINGGGARFRSVVHIMLLQVSGTPKILLRWMAVVEIFGLCETKKLSDNVALQQVKQLRRDSTTRVKLKPFDNIKPIVRSPPPNCLSRCGLLCTVGRLLRRNLKGVYTDPFFGTDA